MRHQAAIILLLAATSAAQAQCPLGSFPTTNADAQVVCQSAAGQRPTVNAPSPAYCPPGATSSIDSWGRRTCSTLSQSGPDRPIGGRIDGPVGGPVGGPIGRY
jgi:hypothetical protein